MHTCHLSTRGDKSGIADYTRGNELQMWLCNAGMPWDISNEVNVYKLVRCRSDIINILDILIKCVALNIVRVKAITHKVSTRHHKKKSYQWILQSVAKFRAANEDPINNSSSVFCGSFSKCFRKHLFDM